MTKMKEKKETWRNRVEGGRNISRRLEDTQENKMERM